MIPISEIIIHDMIDGSGDLIFLGKGLPATPEAIEEMMIGAKVLRPYIANTYSFRLHELNGQITGPQEVDKLNSLATLLDGLSEYERVKLEGAAVLTDCKTPEDCVKLMYNLDSFDLIPNVGDYEALGRYYAANDFAHTLKDVPPEMMKHFDHDQLGRICFDDSTNVFIRGHRIRDMEHGLQEPDLQTTPLASHMAMRLCSDRNPDGVWIKFPLSGMGAVNTPEQSDEIQVALTSLNADSLDECRAVECRSEYPGLSQCLEVHAGEPLEQLVWRGLNLGLCMDELSQYGKDAHDKFAAALEYEECSHLGFATDITQNLRFYTFAPDIPTYAKRHLLEIGVDAALASCFDLETLGNTLVAENSALITESGVISRNGNEFIHDFYRPPQQQQEQNMEPPDEGQAMQMDM